MAAATKQPEAMKLIVKAPNQLIEDQNIDCDLTWTVLNLKEHLSRVYPSKPAVAEQKLIYSGQLLTDDAVLKDILRKYEGQKAHSLHLVCMPPRGTPDTWKKSQSTPQATVQPPQPSVAANQEVEQPTPQQVNRTTAPVTPIVTERPATASVPSSQGQEGWNWFHATQQQFLAASAAQMPTMAAAYPHAAMAHLYDPVNIAQMQQIYSQYMAQYLSRLQQAGVSAEVLGTMHAQAQQNWNVHPNQAPQVAVPEVNPIVPANANPQANVPAAPQMIGADDDDMRLGRQRDWLDWFYVLSRLLVLFSIVYFYSSLKRFVLVSALGILLYLYHLGYFRMQPIGVAEAGENQPPREAVPEAQVEDQNGPDRGEEQQEAVIGEPDGVRQRRHNDANPAEENLPAPNQQPLPPPIETPSAFMLTWTFVTSFFASLIPDRPNVV